MPPGTHPGAQALAQLAAGTLTGRAQATVEAHVRGCEECRAVLAAVGETIAPSGSNLAVRPPGAAPTDPQPGEMLGEYRVLEPLGQGGMGVLYRGEQPVIGKQVAIKVIRRSIAHDAESVQRLIEEARAVNAIRHPNIVDIFSFGKLADGRPYMVMELLEGLSLAELLGERGRLTPAETLAVLTPALAALSAAHEVGVVHRDVKPENIFVNPRSDGWRVTLLDFGLAKRSGGGGGDAVQTHAGMVVGTPAFMAPEQIRGAQVSAAADIYALGVVAWKLLAGRGPFEGGALAEVLQRQLKEPAPPLGPEAPGVPKALEALVMEMLAKDPVERPSTAQVRRRVAELSAQVTQAVAPPPASARGAAFFVAGLAAALVLAAAGWALWWPGGSAEVGKVGQARPLDAPERRAPARAIEPESPPLPREPPPPPVQPEPSEPARPLAAAGPLPGEGTGFRWPCAKVSAVTPIHQVTAGAVWQVFQVTFDYERSLLVTTQGPGPGRAELRRVHAAVKSCKDTARSIVAGHTRPFGMWPTDTGVLLKGGVRAEVEDVAVVAPPNP